GRVRSLAQPNGLATTWAVPMISRWSAPKRSLQVVTGRALPTRRRGVAPLAKGAGYCARGVGGERRDRALLGGGVPAPPARASVRVLRPADRVGCLADGGSAPGHRRRVPRPRGGQDLLAELALGVERPSLRDPGHRGRGRRCGVVDPQPAPVGPAQRYRDRDVSL